MILAIDASSDQAGIVLLDGETLCARRSWRAVRRGGDPMLDHWRDVMTDASIDGGAIDLIAVGLGPGNYSGLRVSLAAARLWALPADIPVAGVGSALGMAIPAAAAAGDPARTLPVIVVGDARRGSVWTVRYPPGINIRGGEQAVTVMPRSTWLRQLIPAVWVSADWDRLGGASLCADLPGRVERSVHGPDPRVLARVAGYRRRQGTAMPPLQPLYIQPPVAQREMVASQPPKPSTEIDVDTVRPPEAAPTA